MTDLYIFAHQMIDGMEPPMISVFHSAPTLHMCAKATAALMAKDIPDALPAEAIGMVYEDAGITELFKDVEARLKKLRSEGHAAMIYKESDDGEALFSISLASVIETTRA